MVPSTVIVSWMHSLCAVQTICQMALIMCNLFMECGSGSILVFHVFSQLVVPSRRLDPRNGQEGPMILTRSLMSKRQYFKYFAWIVSAHNSGVASPNKFDTECAGTLALRQAYAQVITPSKNVGGIPFGRRPSLGWGATKFSLVAAR